MKTIEIEKTEGWDNVSRVAEQIIEVYNNLTPNDNVAFHFASFSEADKTEQRIRLIARMNKTKVEYLWERSQISRTIVVCKLSNDRKKLS